MGWETERRSRAKHSASERRQRPPPPARCPILTTTQASLHDFVDNDVARPALICSRPQHKNFIPSLAPFSTPSCRILCPSPGASPDASPGTHACCSRRRRHSHSQHRSDSTVTVSLGSCRRRISSMSASHQVCQCAPLLESGHFYCAHLPNLASSIKFAKSMYKKVRKFECPKLYARSQKSPFGRAAHSTGRVSPSKP